jgi:hypothetical protein
MARQWMMPRLSYISETEQFARIEGNIFCYVNMRSFLALTAANVKRIALYSFAALLKQTGF